MPELRAIIILSLVLAGSPLRAEVRVGDRFPGFSPTALAEGAIPTIAGKVVLVDFWASWCAPCKASFPAYARLNSEFARQGLVIIAVSVDEDPTAYAAFVVKHAPPFHVLLDHDHALVANVGVPAMPTSYLVDPTGRVRSIHPGFHGAQTERVLRGEIQSLLSGQSP